MEATLGLVDGKPGWGQPGNRWGNVIVEDFYEIDFVGDDTEASFDAIAIRYREEGRERVCIVDGGFKETGQRLLEHIKRYYGEPETIHNILLTHPDADHGNGLVTILEKWEGGIETLWMFRPWAYAAVLKEWLGLSETVRALERLLREMFPVVDQLETLAGQKGIAIEEPVAGTMVGRFQILHPTRIMYVKLLAGAIEEEYGVRAGGVGAGGAEKVAGWGEESFPPDDTGAVNNMSVVQVMDFLESCVVLTGDAGRLALMSALEYSGTHGIKCTEPNFIQIPHHGSRHNVDSQVLTGWLGNKMESQEEYQQNPRGIALASVGKGDAEHPRKVVVRGFMHRGYRCFETRGNTIQYRRNAPERLGSVPVEPLAYPEAMEV